MNPPKITTRNLTYSLTRLKNIIFACPLPPLCPLGRDCWSMCMKQGRRKARVLPVPVWAIPMMSFPVKIRVTISYLKISVKISPESR